MKGYFSAKNTFVAEVTFKLIMCLQDLSSFCYKLLIKHHMHKCMGCYRAIIVITRRVQCFHYFIYITFILLLEDLSIVCCEQLRLILLPSLLILLSTYLCCYNGTSNVKPCIMCPRQNLPLSNCGNN